MKSKVLSYIARDGRSIDQDVRYIPLVDDLRKVYRTGETVLEVGPGDNGITSYMPIDITGVDIAEGFSDKLSSRITPVVTKGIKLPFQDNSFDYVFSIDMLEHIPQSDRKLSLDEMIRVARRKVYISVPTGKKSQALDKELDEYYSKHHNGERFLFVKEHLELGLSTQAEFEKIIKSNKKVESYVAQRNMNISLRRIFMKMWMAGKSPLTLLFHLASRITIAYPLYSFGNCYRSLFYIDIKKQ